MQTQPVATAQFQNFVKSLNRPDLMKWLQSGLVGEGVMVPGPNGPNPMIYADYVASGRALQQIETFISNEVLPYYANSHTEASFCGRLMTGLRKDARQIILNSCKADDRYAVIFSGSGATSALNRMVNLFDVRSEATDAQRPLIIVGPYEHHSNILPWRESGAEVIEVPEHATGGPDMHLLEELLIANQGRRIIGTFSAMSNVTGIVTDVKEVTRLLKRYGALSIWDYAGGAPYLDIDMGCGTDAEIDAIALSPHKFIGGPGASGVLILRRDAVSSDIPTITGGGTVAFVSPWAHDYSSDLIDREEAGTPNVIGDIRAALCFLVKDAIGAEFTSKRLASLRDRAVAAWANTPGLKIVGNPKADRLPIFSFILEGADGQRIHQQLVTRMLSDLYGVQARGGCACAGPYAHRLLDIDQTQSESLRETILQGREIEKPGWTRLGFSVLMSDEKVDQIINAVDALARTSQSIFDSYHVDDQTGSVSHQAA